MGLTEAADRTVRTYSGGMRRRLDLGASLVARPRLLLLDEPTTGLDPRSRLELWDVIRSLVANGTDVLLTTQYLDEADHLASQIAIIDHGHVVASGTPRELKRLAGRNVVEVHVRDSAALDRVAAILMAIGDGPATIDVPTRSVRGCARRRYRARLRRAAAARRHRHRDRRGLRPSTNSRRSISRTHRHTQGGSGMSIAIAPPRGNAAGSFVSTGQIARRVLLKFIRSPQLVVVGTLQGAMFLLIFRYVFGGAIALPGINYVDFVVPGFITTGVLFTRDERLGGHGRGHERGTHRALALAADSAQRGARRPRGRRHGDPGLGAGDHRGDRLPRRLSHPWRVGAAIAAAALVILFGFVFEWVFVLIGMVAGSAQAAQGFALLVFPFTFVSSAYIPVATMPSWMQGFAENQPVTVMVNAVRCLTEGGPAEALLGHPTSYFVIRSLMWSVALVAVFAPLAVARYRRG